MKEAVSGRFDGKAALAIAALAPVLWRCDTPLELDEKQMAAFQQYQLAVPRAVPKGPTPPPCVIV